MVFFLWRDRSTIIGTTTFKELPVRIRIVQPLIALSLFAATATAPAFAANFMDALKGGAAGMSMPQVGSSTMGNAAGVLQYCVKNNYLAGGDASSVKDKLLAKITGQKPQQSGYAAGAKGLLQGSDGNSFNLKSISGKLKEKACDYVLDNAKSLI